MTDRRILLDLIAVTVTGLSLACNAQVDVTPPRIDAQTAAASASSPATDALTLKAAVQKAITSNPEVLARYHAFRASEGELMAVRGAMLPHLDVIGTYGRENRKDPLLVSNFRQSDTTLQLTQLLWDGLSSFFQKLQFDHARLVRLFELFDASEAAALETARTYFDVLRYRQLVELAEDNYVQHRSVLEQIEAKVTAGVGRRVDLEQATGRMALAESNLLVEISNLHDVSARFQRLVGEAPAKEMLTPDGLDQNVPATMVEGLKNIYSLNPQVRAAIENVRSASYAANSRKGLYSPRVELRLRDDRGKDLNGYLGQTRNQTAEVLVNFNIFNGFSDLGRDRQTVEQWNEAKDQRDKACRDTRQTYEIAFNDVRKLHEQLVYLDRQRLSVEKARDAYRKQFDIGQRSLLDLLDTENELFQAKRSYANAEYDLSTAYVRIHAGAGRLLPALGLSALETGAMNDIKDWEANGESPELCPPEPVALYVADKKVLDDRAAEMTKDRVKVMMEAIAARQATANAAAEQSGVVIAPPTSVVRPPAPTANSPDSEVQLAVKSWAAAWSGKKLDDYFAAYGPSFVPSFGLTRPDWEVQRKARIESAGAISVVIENLEIAVKDGTHAEARFTQKYQTDSYHDIARKTLMMVRQSGRWLIVREKAEAIESENQPAKSANP